MKLTALLILIFGQALTGQDQSGRPGAYDILERVDRNMYSESRIVESEMTIHGRRTSRTISARTWAVG